MQEVYYSSSGPQFISGERICAKGTPPPFPKLGKKVPFQNQSRNPPTWPYAVLTMPHDFACTTESEKLELLAPTEVHGKVPPAKRADFADHHLSRPGITGFDIEVNTQLEKAESFYCTGNGCWACKKKEKVSN